MNPASVLEQVMTGTDVTIGSVVKEAGIGIPARDSSGEEFLYTIIRETRERYRMAAVDNEYSIPFLDDADTDIVRIAEMALPCEDEEVWRTFLDIQGWKFSLGEMVDHVDTDDATLRTKQYLFVIAEEIAWAIWQTLTKSHSDVMFFAFRERGKNQCECGAYWCSTDHTYENNLRAFDPES